MRHRTGASLALAALVVTQLGISGCASWSRQSKGTVIGAGAGAAAGAAIGKATGNVARGAIIGAVVGGAAGAIIGHQMDQQAKEIEASVEGATVTRVGEGLVVTFDSGLLFDFDRSELRTQARTNLEHLAASLQKYPGENVMVIGHTDNVGTGDYNQKLSEARAQAAATLLQQQGVDVARIRTRGMGEADPVASNETADGRQQNRRVELALYASDAWKKQATQQVGLR
jgi:outer membrane protein OmpA-like peptidoglycan-associated protein